MQAQNEIANQSIMVIDDLIKIQSGLGIVFCGNDKNHNPWALMHRYQIFNCKSYRICLFSQTISKNKVPRPNNICKGIL